ncbi:helicase domain protein [Nitzschia inconspicua]|uniref:Helicase domain protein n=1 Tax=Nitzschia inconspicua TaxID=303405 RepID=A0A9K3L7T3_9STRA|nr:helicase domain protein [Nitzschia inconspicua]
MSTDTPQDPAVEVVPTPVAGPEGFVNAPNNNGHVDTTTPISTVMDDAINDGEDASHETPAVALGPTSPPATTNGLEEQNSTLAFPVHKASSSRTAEALREFKRKMGLCEVEGCEHKVETIKDDMEVCQHHFDNGVDAPVEPLRRGRKRKSEVDGDDNPGSPTPSSNPDDASSGIPKNTCLIEGCEKLRAKGGFCTRHFKDRSAPIRSGPADYERRYCMKEGCDKLRSKGLYCHRHNQDIEAPVKNKAVSAVTTYDRKKLCTIEGCDRLQVKGGYCSRHSKNPNAPVKDTPAFSFDADARWDELFPILEAFAKEHGHARYPTSKKTDMAKFVTQIRSVYRQKRNRSVKGNPNADPNTVEPDLSSSKLLTPERMEALQSIGFEFQLWTVEPGQWEQRFQELLEYKEKHNNFNVTSRENATLSSWCKTQRQRYKNTMAIYQGIYGEEFTGTQQKAQQLYEKAKKMAEDAREKEQTLDISQVTEAKHIMDPDKICKLQAVGFEWDLQKDSFEQSWENRYMELMRFKLVNGHCRVPKTGDNPQLGQWVKQMRKYFSWKMEGKSYPKTFTDDRIQRLNELGFEWRLKDPTSGTDVEDQKPEATILGFAGVGDIADMARRVGVTMDNVAHRPLTADEVNRFEPFRTNASLYEQRGWL